MDRKLRAALTGIGLVGSPLPLGPSDALADILATAARTVPYSIQGTIPLNDSGSQSLTFTTAKPNQKIVITYNAECVVTAGWLAVRIFVDRREANPPSDTDFAFCSAPGNAHGVVRQSVLTLPKAGAHVLAVGASVSDGSASFSLDDTSLVVKN